MTSPAAAVPAIRASGLDVALSGVPIVRGVDLEVASGEAIAILGNNGSGKTTLMRALLGLIPHRGVVELFGAPLPQFREWQRVGYVPQRSGILVQQATAREVVASGRLGQRPWLMKESDADRKVIDASLAAVALDERAGIRFARLSGGQQQRVLIARALACEADLMVWDEPLAGVDHATQELLAEVARDLKAQGATIVMVLHEIGPFSTVLDRAVMVRDGRIGPHQPQPVHHHGGHETGELADRADITGLEGV